MSITLITGPSGAGKSTLMRRLMSHYDSFVDIPGGVNGLPLMRILDKRLVVLGNYDDTRRARQGMTQFTKDDETFQLVMKMAMEQTLPVICEGGFQRPKRMHTETGRAFCRRTEIIYLDTDAKLCRDGLTSRGDFRSEESRLAHIKRLRRCADEMVLLGSKMTFLYDRDIAFKTMAEKINLPNPDRPWTPPPSDFR